MRISGSVFITLSDYLCPLFASQSDESGESAFLSVEVPQTNLSIFVVWGSCARSFNDIASKHKVKSYKFLLPGGAVVAHGSQQPERSGSKIFSRGNGAEDTREKKGTKERAR